MVQLTPPVLQAPALSPLTQLPPTMMVATAAAASTPATASAAQGYPSIPRVTVTAPSPPKAAAPVSSAASTTTYGVPVPLVHVVAKASATSNAASGTAVATGAELPLRSTSPTRIAAPTVYTAPVRVPSPPGSACGLGHGFEARALSPPRRWGSAEMVPPAIAPQAMAPQAMPPLTEPVQRPPPPPANTAPEPVADHDPLLVAATAAAATSAATAPATAASASSWGNLPTVPRVEAFLPRPALWRSREESASMPTLFDAAEQRKRWQQQNQELLRHMQELEQAKSIVAAQSAQALKKIRQRHQQLHAEMEQLGGDASAEQADLLEAAAAAAYAAAPNEPASSSSSSRQLQHQQKLQQQQQQRLSSQDGGSRLPATERAAPGRGKASDQDANWSLPSPARTQEHQQCYSGGKSGSQSAGRAPSETAEMDGFQVDAQLPSPGNRAGHSSTNGGRQLSQASSLEQAWSRPVAMPSGSPQQQQQHRSAGSASTTTGPVGTSTFGTYGHEQTRTEAQQPWQGTGPEASTAEPLLLASGSMEEELTAGLAVQPVDSSDMTPRDVVPALSPSSMMPQQPVTPTTTSFGFGTDPNMGPGISLAASTLPPTASATGQGMEAVSSGQAPSMSEAQSASASAAPSAAPSAPSRSQTGSAAATPPPPSAKAKRAPIPPAQERGSAARQTARGSRGSTPPQPPSTTAKTREANRPSSSGGSRDAAPAAEKGAGQPATARSRSTPGSAKGESPATSARGTNSASSSKRPPLASAKASSAAAASEKSSGSAGGASTARGTPSGHSPRTAGAAAGGSAAQRTRSTGAASAAATATASTASAAAAAAATAASTESEPPLHGLEGESEELQAELEECLDTIQWSASSMGRENLQDLKNLQSPAPIVKAVLESVALVLGQPQTRWDQLKRFISSDGFLSKLQKFNFQQAVTKDTFKKLKARLEDPEFDEEFIKSVCVPVVPFAIWCRAIGVYLSKTKFPGGAEVRPLAGAGTTTTTTNSQRQYPQPSSGDVPMIFEPDLQDLSPEELRHVRDLTVSRPNVGSITFHGETDCTGLDFASIVRLEAGEVLVYPDSSQKPPVGEGLNKAATVTMFQCYPPNGNKLLQDPRSQEKYKRKIQAMTEEKHARFIDYDCLTGVWKFSVDQF